MKKAILFSFLALGVIINPKQSSSQAFKNGDNVIGAGIGFGSALASTYSSQSPGLSVLFEHGNWDVGPGVISWGGYLGYKSFSYNYYGYNYNPVYGYYYSTTVSSYSWSYFIVGARGAYHYTGIKNDKLDLYGGIMISLDISSYSNNALYDNYFGSGYGGTGVEVTPFVGVRYYLTDKFAVYSELGYGVTFFNIGVALKF